MEADVAYFVTYPCPHCKLELEAEHGDWQGWLRCPSCGSPSLPPEILLGHPATMRRIRGIEEGDDPAVASDSAAPDGPTAPYAPAVIDPPLSPMAGVLRMVFLTGLVMSLFILLIAYLDDNQKATTIFGALAIIFFLLLLRLPGRRR